MIDIDINYTSSFNYDVETLTSLTDMNNRLFCTFTPQSELENTVHTIETKHKILYGKIFILYAPDQDEYLCTYNVDLGNTSGFLPNTILVHRKKESNTLYTINSLNRLIESLNRGILDINYRVNWNDYRNCILLTKGPELRKLSTQLYKIVEI
jgi:hypothetical protein